ncbi:MAG: response regulator [Nitrospinaceae bacterium]|jgi:DNA-binding response OmpR family regulator|nr:response regulator [Nitrospinaceae bacterium]MBT3432767.1 response regulator [Nitrospinaceae bacterium]MBT4429932.1 response regulator [Nitrospinaceae bacterium]MBT5369868.1 response regulator [Nitrospinaceae bacterium]MBT6395337.1 response regulator [Nitrospinaceae bacterium]
MNGPVPVSTNAPVGVYVIDDDPDVVSFIRTILVEAGFRVETETDSTAAMKKKLPFRPDVLMIDIMMPGISGLEIMERITGSAGREKFRIITVSTLTRHADIERAAAAGADDYLAKPFHPEELLLRVRRQVDELKKSRVVPVDSSPPALASLRLDTPPPGEMLVEEMRAEKTPSFVESLRHRQQRERSKATAAPLPGDGDKGPPRMGPRAQPSGAKILVIDDDPDILALVKSIFSAAGHNVSLAEDGEAGLALAGRDEPDLIVLDIMMPRMSGYDVVEALAKKSHTAGIPILMLTSKNSSEDVTEGLSGFADEYVTKPFRPEELAARAGALIRRTRGRTRNKREQLWVIEQFADKGARMGYQVFSPHMDKVADAPLNWKGPVPDLVIQKGRRVNAYLVESVESLHDDRTIGRWAELEEIDGLILGVVGMSRESSRLATKIKRERGFNARVQWSRPRQFKRRRWIDSFRDPRLVAYVVAMGLALFFSLFISGTIPNVFELLNQVNTNFVNQMKIYRPHDSERQLRNVLDESRKLQKLLNK